jgi:hypothetical protein
MGKVHTLTLNPTTQVVVHLNHAAHVLLFDPTNFAQYKATGRARGQGGAYERTPVVLSSPGAGTFYLVVDLGQYRGPLNYRVELRDAA